MPQSNTSFQTQFTFYVGYLFGIFAYDIQRTYQDFTKIQFLPEVNSLYQKLGQRDNGLSVEITIDDINHAFDKIEDCIKDEIDSNTNVSQEARDAAHQNLKKHITVLKESSIFADQLI